MENTTAAYWRKLLGFERAPDVNILKRVKSPLRLFRPLLFAIAVLFIDKACDYQVEGVENITVKAPFILASNHLSNFDYPFLVRKIPRTKLNNLYVIAKKWLFKHPVTRFFVQISANCVFVDEKIDFMQSLRAASDILRLKKSVYIAPEGQRSFDGKVGEFKVGVGVLAVENNVPIIPAKIEGTYQVLPRGKVFPRLGQKVKIKFGKPIYPDQYKKNKSEENAYYIYKSLADDLRKVIVEM